MDYFDILLAKKLEDDRDPKVEGLSVSANGRYHEDGVVYDPVIVNVPETPLSKLTVTENGTYTAPSGTAYNEVEVDVPLPENAYLLKDIENTPTAIATFSDGANLPMPKLEIGIEPVQDLHGYDAPWVGGSGKNKFDIDAEHTSSPATYFYELIVKPNTAYTMSSNVPQSNPASLYFNGGTTNVNGVWSGTPRTFTSDENGKLIAEVRYNTSQGGIDLYTAVKNGTYYIQLEEGSTATTYEPYSNICPISGWDEVNVSVSGVNVWDEEWVNGLYVDGVLNPAFTNYVSSKNKIPIKPNTKYYFKIASVASSARDRFYYDIEGNYIGSQSGYYTDLEFTTPSNAYFMNFSLGAAYGNTYNNDISINYPSTATAYEPYNGQTYTIDLDGTRYGGTLDVVSGVLTVDKAEIDLGSRTYNKAVDGYFYAYISDISIINFNVDEPTAKCEIYKLCASDEWYGRTIDSGIFGVESSHVIYIADTRFSDGDSLKTALVGKKLVYELATPLTIQLTPTLVKSLRGMNNVYADSGDILDLSYFGKEE